MKPTAILLLHCPDKPGIITEITKFITDNNGNKKYKSIPCNISSYFRMFLNCEIYRESCYSCKYATEKRV